MLEPKKIKHRKHHKGRSRKRLKETRGVTLNFGSFGLQAHSSAWITARQIESARRTITHSLKREGKVWIRIFPDKPVTKKPAEVRMGKGKGAPEYWVAVVKPGTILFESDGVDTESAKEAFRLAANKLPIKTKFCVRRDYDGK